MSTEKYNGWSNYPTWVVNLWLTNDKYTYNDVRALIRTCLDDYQAAERIENYVREYMLPADMAGLVSDLLESALAECDFTEIARDFNDEEEEEDKEEKGE